MMKITKYQSFVLSQPLKMTLCQNIFKVIINPMLEMNNITMGWHAFRGWFLIIKAIKVLSKKLCTFAHFLTIVTAVCVVKFGLRKKIEAYLYKPYLVKLN